jgi:hypothetical protein
MVVTKKKLVSKSMRKMVRRSKSKKVKSKKGKSGMSSKRLLSKKKNIMMRGGARTRPVRPAGSTGQIHTRPAPPPPNSGRPRAVTPPPSTGRPRISVNLIEPISASLRDLGQKQAWAAVDYSQSPYKKPAVDYRQTKTQTPSGIYYTNSQRAPHSDLYSVPRERSYSQLSIGEENYSTVDSPHVYNSFQRPQPVFSRSGLRELGPKEAELGPKPIFGRKGPWREARKQNNIERARRQKAIESFQIKQNPLHRQGSTTSTGSVGYDKPLSEDYPAYSAPGYTVRRIGRTPSSESNESTESGYASIKGSPPSSPSAPRKLYNTPANSGRIVYVPGLSNSNSDYAKVNWEGKPVKTEDFYSTVPKRPTPTVPQWITKYYGREPLSKVLN